MSKKLLAVLLTFVMIFTLAACGGNSGESATGDASTELEEVTIKVYNPVAGTVTDGSIDLFAQKVEELSGGKITCDITPAGTLGAEREATQLMQMGDIDMAVFSIDGLEWLMPGKAFWLCLPGLITSWEEVDAYNDGWMFQAHKEMAAEAGIDLICPGEFGLKAYLGTGEPIRTFEDFKGKVIRVPDVDLNQDYISALGAMPISGIDMYTGLQQGTMDVVHNNIPASELFKLDEVVDWITLTWDMYGTNYYVANKEFTDGLSDAAKEIIYTAAEEAAGYIRDQYRGNTEAWIQKCKDNPDIEVIEIDDEFKAQIMEASYQIWDQYRDKYPAEIMDKIYEEYYPEQ